jgi:hypothetical protein
VSVEYRIVEISQNSPLYIAVEEETTGLGKGRGKPAPAVDVPGAFVSRLRLVGSKGYTPRTEHLSELLALEDLVEPVGDTIRQMTIRAEGRRVAIGAPFKKKIAKMLGPDEHILGMVTGALEAIDVHNKHRCYVYPALGPKRVRCDFPESMTPRVVGAIGSRVRVYGRLAYKAWSNFPHRVQVQDFTVLPPDSELPRFSDLAHLYAGESLTPDDFATWPDDEP